MALWRWIRDIVVLLIVLGFLRSCWLHHQCPLCGTYTNPNHRYISFTIRENNPNVTHCDSGASTPYEDHTYCYTFTLQKGDDDDTFYLRMPEPERNKYAKRYSVSGLIVEDTVCQKVRALSVVNDHWLCESVSLPFEQCFKDKNWKCIGGPADGSYDQVTR